MSRLLTVTILVCLLLSLFCSSAVAASCHISKPWSVEVEGRSDRNVPAILPSPYCLLLSDRLLNESRVHYALNVRDGSVAWVWPTFPSYPDTQTVQLQTSADPHRVYALVTFAQGARHINDSQCAWMAALHSGTGQPLWQHELCIPTPIGVTISTAFQVMQPPMTPANSSSTAAERIVLIMGSSSPEQRLSYSLIHVLAGSTGRLLSDRNLTIGLVDSTLQRLGNGSDGYFSLRTASATMELYQLSATDHIVRHVATNPPSLIASLLYSQPTLHYNDLIDRTQLAAYDVASNEQLWTSHDTFMEGLDWANDNGTFSHYSTAYQLIDTHPNAFLVLNTAFDHHGTVIAQVGMYQLSNGASIAHSPLLIFDHLDQPDADPTTWLFDRQQSLLLRGDTVWYTLHVPTLKVVQQGHYATSDAPLKWNKWLVYPDGSYVALLSGSSQSAVRGYPPYVNSSVAMGREQLVEMHRHVQRT